MKLTHNPSRIATSVLLVQLLGAAVVCASDTDPANGRLAVSRQQQAAAQAEAAHRAAEEARLAAERDQRTAEEHARADELAAAEQAAAKAEYERRAAEQRATTAQPAGDGVAWGAPADGLQAGLTLKSTSRAPRVSAVLVLHLRNASDQPVRILKLASQARYWGACLPLDIRSSGVTLKFQGPNLEPPPLPNESEFITLDPGDSDSTGVTFAPQHWNLTVPFDVQAVFLFKQTLSESTAGPFDQSTRQWRTVGGLWTGETRSRAVGISISNDAAKPEDTGIQALIERFGNRQPGVSPGSNTASAYFEALTKGDVERANALVAAPFSFDRRQVLQTKDEVEKRHQEVVAKKGRRKVPEYTVSISATAPELDRKLFPEYEVFRITLAGDDEHIDIYVTKDASPKVIGVSD